MMTAVATPPRRLRAALFSMRYKITTAIILIALSDFLFFRHAPGLSIAVFISTLCLAFLTTNPEKVRPVRLAPSLLLLIIGLLPVVYSSNLLSIFLSITSAILFIVVITGGRLTSLPRDYRFILHYVSGVWGLIRFANDIILTTYLVRRYNSSTQAPGVIATWLIPITFGFVFLFLLVKANPIIEDWLFHVLSFFTFDHEMIVRILFWSAAFILIWPFMRARSVTASPKRQTIEASSSKYFNVHSVLRALILFNLIFAVQTVLDATYLWNGLKLPDSLTYAEYAHRGAYPLIATALLAGGFVLIALRPGADTNKSGLIKFLVYLWIGQNILLVASSMLRLDLYVHVYHLTYLRVAAFIWMGLVAIGLGLIVMRILLQRSNQWLIKWNCVALLSTLYVCSFLNFSQFIADHNTKATSGLRVDYSYLCSLGRNALPAIDAHIKATEQTKGLLNAYDAKLHRLKACRDKLVANHETSMANWRSWSYRGYQLSMYLKTRAHTGAESSFEP